MISINIIELNNIYDCIEKDNFELNKLSIFMHYSHSTLSDCHQYLDS